jgi:hypothetical protein
LRIGLHHRGCHGGLCVCGTAQIAALRCSDADGRWFGGWRDLAAWGGGALGNVWRLQHPTRLQSAIPHRSSHVAGVWQTCDRLIS